MSDYLPELEQLLEQLGAKEFPGDTRHRYALRRALLISPIFDANRTALRWFHVFTVTGSALAGGFVVAIFVISVSSITPLRTNQTGGVPVAQASAEVQFASENAVVPVSRSRVLPEVRLVNVADFVTKTSMDRWVAMPIEMAVSH